MYEHKLYRNTYKKVSLNTLGRKLFFIETLGAMKTFTNHIRTDFGNNKNIYYNGVHVGLLILYWSTSQWYRFTLA